MKRHYNFFTKAICLLVVIAACAVGFIACNNGDAIQPDVTTVTTAATTLPPAAESDLTLVADNEAKVKVVYGASDNSFASDSAKALGEALGALGSVEVPVAAAAESDGAVEILVGNTGREESSKAMSELAPNSYSVTVSGNSIIVVANNIYLYEDAVDELLKAVVVSDGEMTLANNYSKKSKSYPVVSLAADKKSDYTIVYESAGFDGREQATALKNAFASAGITINALPDTQSVSGKEILIGATNRALSDKSKAYYFNAHIFSDKDGNLAVTGNFEAGVDRLIKYVGELAKAGGNIDLPEHILGIVNPEGYGYAPEYQGVGDVKVVEGFESVKSYYIQADGADTGDYKDYAELLVEEGFKLYYSTEVKDSMFSTYTDGYNIVNLAYIEYLGIKEKVNYVNIAVDTVDNSALPKLEDNSEKITDVQVTQINTVNAFIVRLEDGRFIVIDGGLKANNNKNNADLIYNQLVAQNVLEGKPTIAAWFITHPHTDHVNAYYDFTKRYNTKVDLEMVVCNLPNSEMDRVEQSNEVVNGALTEYKNTKLVVAHIGQRFAFAGADIDILFTYENLYDASHVESSNLSSMVFSIDMPGGKMTITGDMYTAGCKTINAIYGDALKCDVVQFCHHSYNGGDEGMYKSMGAKVGIWSTSVEDANSRELYGKVSYNHIPVELYDMHLIMSQSEDYMILKAGMTKEDLKQFRKFEKK